MIKNKQDTRGLVFTICLTYFLKYQLAEYKQYISVLFGSSLQSTQKFLPE